MPNRTYQSFYVSQTLRQKAGTLNTQSQLKNQEVLAGIDVVNRPRLLPRVTFHPLKTSPPKIKRLTNYYHYLNQARLKGIWPLGGTFFPKGKPTGFGH